jgi:hypothetical protein
VCAPSDRGRRRFAHGGTPWRDQNSGGVERSCGMRVCGRSKVFHLIRRAVSGLQLHQRGLLGLVLRPNDLDRFRKLPLGRGLPQSPLSAPVWLSTFHPSAADLRLTYLDSSATGRRKVDRNHATSGEGNRRAYPADPGKKCPRTGSGWALLLAGRVVRCVDAF